MTAAGMEFGPEWLRNLSGEAKGIQSSPPGYNGGGTPSNAKKRLQYTRSELVSLFTEKAKPHDVSRLEKLEIFKEDPQAPPVLGYQREDSGGAPGFGPTVDGREFATISGPSRFPEGYRGRGGHIAGRGRGQGPIRPVHEDERYERRNKAFDKEFDEIGHGERRRYERNPSYPPREHDEPVAPPGPPRKPGFRAAPVDNWRTANSREGDREGWRNPGDREWTNNRHRDWRPEEGGRDNRRDRGGRDEEYYRNGGAGPGRYREDRRESLPEWSLDDDGPSFGTFDATGVFCAESGPEDELEYRSRPSTDETMSESKPNRRVNGSTTTNKNDSSVNQSDLKRDSSKKSHQDPADDSSAAEQPVQSRRTNQSQGQDVELRNDDDDIERNTIGSLFADESHPDSVKSRQFPSASAPANPHNEGVMVNHLNVVHGQIVQSLPQTHPEAYKWLYLDPQQETQGPFNSKEMLEWFRAGYFLPSLLVRRACDDCFMELGRLIRYFGSLPFQLVPNQQPPPIISRNSVIAGSNSAASSSRMERAPLMGDKALNSQQSSSVPLKESSEQNPILSMFARLQQQQQQQQQAPQSMQKPAQQINNSVDIQNQLRGLLGYLKQQEGFNRLSEPQQKNVLLQMQTKLMSQQQEQKAAAAAAAVSEPQISSSIPNENLNPTLVQLFGARAANPLRNRSSGSAWGLPLEPSSGQTPVYASDLEVLQRKEQETHERLKLEEHQRRMSQQKSFEDETRKRMEMEEIMRKRQDEDMRHLDEIRRKNDEAERIRRELVRQKEQEEIRRRETEERMRREAEDRIRREAEEIAALEEDRRKRIEDGRRLMQEQKVRDSEQQRKVQEAQHAKLFEHEKIRQDQMRLHLHEQDLIRAHQKQQFDSLRIMSEQQQKQNAWLDDARKDSPPTNMSLSDIQKAQEEKDRSDREEREKQKRRQQQIQHQQLDAIMKQQQQLQQQQSQKSTQDQNSALAQLKAQHLSWANMQHQQQSVRSKTLAEIQAEEAEKLAREMEVAEKKKQQTGSVSNAGIWSNAASHLQWKREQEQRAASAALTPAWGGAGVQVIPASASSHASSTVGRNKAANSAVSMGFWESGPISEQPKPSNMSNQSASALSLSKSVASKQNPAKENVMKLFERKSQSDEFTHWCTKTLKSYESKFDVVTFVDFLKDVESPYDITDYCREYLPDGKETKEFVKQFIEKRSYFRNKAKQNSNEELTGPAKAVIPSSIKANSALLASADASPGDASSPMGQKGKRGKKNKTKALAGSAILGFTVQADPNRMQGELDTLED